MSHFIIIRSMRIVETSDMLATLRRVCSFPYGLSGKDGYWNITTEDEEHCTKLEYILEHLGIEILAVDELLEGVQI